MFQIPHLRREKMQKCIRNLTRTVSCKTKLFKYDIEVNVEKENEIQKIYSVI